MSYQFLTTRREGAIEYLTLNRPDVCNAFNEHVISELSQWAAATRALKTGEVRVVVLAGAGKLFCAGADITWMSKTIQYTEAENLRDATAMSQMFAALNDLPMPLIGRIHGAALGGGAGLAAVCDIVVADEAATFGFTEVRLGIVPAVISPFALAKIGTSAARRWFVTGERFTADVALRIGLIHEVADDLDAAVENILGELLSAGPEAARAAKELARAPQSAEETARRIAAHRTSTEGQEGLRAFLEKRKPNWSK